MGRFCKFVWENRERPIKSGKPSTIWAINSSYSTNHSRPFLAHRFSLGSSAFSPQKQQKDIHYPVHQGASKRKFKTKTNNISLRDSIWPCYLLQPQNSLKAFKKKKKKKKSSPQLHTFIHWNLCSERGKKKNLPVQRESKNDVVRASTSQKLRPNHYHQNLIRKPRQWPYQPLLFLLFLQLFSLFSFLQCLPPQLRLLCPQLRPPSMAALRTRSPHEARPGRLFASAFCFLSLFSISKRVDSVFISLILSSEFISLGFCYCYLFCL